MLAFATYIVLAWVIIDVIRICGSFVHQYNVRFRDIVEIAKVNTGLFYAPEFGRVRRWPLLTAADRRSSSPSA